VCKNPWRPARGKCSWRGSAGCCGAKCTRRAAAAPGEGKSRKRAASDPGLRRQRCGVGAGLESEGGHLVLLVADAQREVVQGAVNDGVWAIVHRLERRYVSVPPHGHRRCAGKVVGQLRRRAAAVLCLVAVCSAALSVLENCSRKISEGSSGESKNWPGKMSGETNTA
jgi:hypothetical protein